GLRDDRYVEVREGLFPGDRIVVRGGYALNAARLAGAPPGAGGHDHSTHAPQAGRTTRMLYTIIHLSLRPSLLLLACAVFVLVYGLYALSTLSVDVFPDLNRPVVTIFAEAEGLAPEEVEARITFPLESAMNGATGVFRVRSASSIGLALVWVEFEWTMDIYIARQIVTEKLQQVAASLPPTLKP